MIVLKKTISFSDLDGRYYTEAEVDALIASVSGTTGSGITDHSELNELDYALSGHTGFQPAGTYLTNAEFPRYYIEESVSILVNDFGQYVIHELGQIEIAGTFELGVGSMLIIEPASCSGVLSSDHGGLVGLGDDDHNLYHTDVRGDVRYHRMSFELITLDSDDISNKYIDLLVAPKSTNSLNIFVEGGIKGELNIDYTVSGTNVDWSGGDWSGLLSVGDRLSITCWY